MKKAVKMLLCSMLFVLLTGCSGGSKYEVDAERLKNSAGEYQFHDLVWGSSVSEAEEILGSTLTTMGKVEEREVFQAEDAFVWSAVEGDFTCEFDQGTLDTVNILFKPKEEQQEQFWKSIREELFTLYGSVEADVRTGTSEELQITTESETYLWEATIDGHTAMTISKLSVNGEFKYIALSVYIIPEEK